VGHENLLQLTIRILSFLCFPSPPVTVAEKDKIISTIQELEFKYLIVSGGLSEGMSVDFYKQIAEMAKTNSKLIIDTSGAPLRKALEAGVYMIKPNVGELAKLVGVEHLEMEEVNEAAK
jgi:6-phosphofructokinase 2